MLQFLIFILYLIGLLFLGVIKGTIVTSSLTDCFCVFELDQLFKSVEQILDILNQSYRQNRVTKYNLILVKMVSEPEWSAFASYLEDINFLKRSFNSSEIIHIPLTHNSKADSLARSARKQLSFVVHMDAELPGWFAEST